MGVQVYWWVQEAKVALLKRCSFLKPQTQFHFMLCISKACFVFFTDQWKQHRVSPKNEDEVRPSNLQR